MAHRFGYPCGKGTFEQIKRGKWRVRFSLGRNPDTGKYEYSRGLIVDGSKNDAVAAAAEFRRQLEIEAGSTPSDMAVGEYAERWQERRATTGKVKEESVKRSKPIVERIVRLFGDIPLAQLDVKALRERYDNAMRKKLMSASQYHMTHQKLKQILDDAVADELIVANPAHNKAISAPTPKVSSRKSLTKEQATKLHNLLFSDELCSREMGVLLGLATGCRRGEILGLQWKHVRLDDSPQIQIEQQLSDKHYGLEPPKSPSAYRHVSLDAETAQRLQDWQVRQRELLAMLDIAQTKETPVITDDHGDWHSPDNYGRWFRDFCVKHGFGRYTEVDKPQKPAKDGKKPRGRKPKTKHYEGLKFHELRHTQATLLIGSGTDIKTVQTRLGHSRASTTMDIYSHALQENDRHAADAMGAILKGK
jgi:integrase